MVTLLGPSVSENLQLSPMAGLGIADRTKQHAAVLREHFVYGSEVSRKRSGGRLLAELVSVGGKRDETVWPRMCFLLDDADGS